MEPTQPEFEVPATVEAMLFPSRKAAGVLYEPLRRKGRHSLQIVMDTVAYAHNIQIRLLRPVALANLAGEIKTLVTAPNSKDDVANILRTVDLEQNSWSKLYDAAILKEVHDWMAALVLGKTNNATPKILTTKWLSAMVALLPHIETKVWLTSLSNPFPAHALCRMQSTWALYVLLSVWDKRAEYSGDSPNHMVEDTIGIKGFIGRSSAKFSVPNGEGGNEECVLVLGPAFETSEENNDELDLHARYKNAFNQFNRGLADAGIPSELHSTVNEQEIADALMSRIEFPEDEIKIRSKNALDTLKLLMSTRISSDAPPYYQYSEGQAPIFKRSHWNKVAVLCTWLIRWNDMIGPECKDGEKLLLHWNKCKIALLAEYRGFENDKPDWSITIIPYNKEKPAEEQIIATKIIPIKTKLAEIEDKSSSKRYRIDRVEILYNRIKERQNAAWSRQILAVNNLLMRHGSASTEWGSDEIATEDPAPGAKSIKAGKASHLLKGFGRQICKYLVDITRADIADIFWLDYSQTPPRLIHTGGYARTLPHIVQSDDIFRGFDEWAWRNDPNAPANLGKNSPSQCYRAIATGKEHCHPKHGDIKHEFYVECYGKIKPEDSIALPLLVNNRVIGILLLGGLVPLQFNRRLLTPLQTIASAVASTMYQQSQLWQMRRLNSLFAKSDISIAFRQNLQDNNVLKSVVSCLTNIFLCPVVQIWLSDESKPFTYKLRGYNWPSPTQNDGRIPAFNYRPLNRREELSDDDNKGTANPKKDGFLSLAVDLWAGEKGDAQTSLAKFVQGQYNPNIEKSEGYSANTAHSGIVKLGLDFLPKEDLPDNAELHILRRKQIFCVNDMRDIMSFALVRRQTHSSEQGNPHWQIVGAITLHDRGTDFEGRKMPWDNGWCPVVAHIQTYLPNLFAQAEVLSNPVANAQAYYLHAARALIVSMKSTGSSLQNTLQKILAPDHSVRHQINGLLDNKQGDPKQALLSASKLMSDAWDELQNLRQTDWMDNLDRIAALMHEHKNIYAATTNIAVGNESFNLRTEIDVLSQAYNDHFHSKHINATVDIPPSVRLRLPLIQLRIVLYDLIHNAAKYTVPFGLLQILWDETSNALLIRNEGPYDADLDQPELLLQYRVRGSAAKTMPELKKNNNQDRKGTGTGLWGCKAVCGQIGVTFDFSIAEMKTAVYPHPIAWYNAKLIFTERMRIGKSALLPKNFY